MAESNIFSVGSRLTGEAFIKSTTSTFGDQAFVNEYEIFSAISHDDPDYLQIVLSKEVDAGNTPFYFNRVIAREEDHTPLHLAAIFNRVKCAKLLIDSFNVDVNVICQKGKIPLQWAIEKNSTEVVYLLMVEYKNEKQLSHLSKEQREKADEIIKQYEKAKTKSSKMTHMGVYEKYVDKLVKVLPMDDVTFTMQLSSHNLLPDSVDAIIKPLPTPCEKADYFLKHAIKPSLDINETEELDNLIIVMQKCGYPHIKRLANKMKLELIEES